MENFTGTFEQYMFLVRVQEKWSARDIQHEQEFLADLFKGVNDAEDSI